MLPSPNITCSRLNNDVLREIFIRCTCIDQNLSSCFEVGASNHGLPQLSVSRVCSSWRHVALLTPQLWNNIAIWEFTDTSLSIAREYLSRAGNLPVSITFGPDWTDERQLTNFLSSYRLQTLTVYMSASHLLLPQLPQRSVADIESLNILGDGSEGTIDLNDIRYPKLALVRIWGLRKISGYSTSLRIFDGRRLMTTVTESWDLLSSCPSLENVQLLIPQILDTRLRPVSVPQIQHQHLRSLSLCPIFEIMEIPFSTFIQALALPAIEEITMPEGQVAWSSTAFQSLAYRSNHFPYLRDVVFINPTSVVDTGALLESMPSLKRMDLLWSIHNKHVIFDRLALDGLASGVLAPQLQSLTVGSISNEGEFMDMVESRMKNASTDGFPAPFTKVTYCPTHCPDLARLHDMQQRGIPIDRY